MSGRPRKTEDGTPAELRRLQLFFALLIGGMLGFLLLQAFGRSFVLALILVPVVAIALAKYPAQFFYERSRTGRK